MPTIRINNTNIYYEDTGRGPETLVFSHSLLFSLRMFDDQVEAFKNKYRCISFDFRGQGKSEITKTGYDIDTLTEDAAQLIRELGAAPCHFFGLSMGGFVGMRLAIRHPELLKSLILADTSADPEPEENLPRYNLLKTVARLLGLRVVVNKVMPIMFGEPFLKDPNRKDQRQKWKRQFLANNRTGLVRAVTGVLSREGIADQLHKIDLPTLILVGDKDVATVPAKSEKMHKLIKDSRLRIIPNAGHMSTVDEPETVNRYLAGFLESLA